MPLPRDELPPLVDILKTNPGWLDEAVTTAEASRIVGFPPSTLSTWRSRGGGPAFLKVGTAVRYQRRALFEWLAGRERANTADNSGADA